MCGIAGFIGWAGVRADAALGHMLDAINHRGPDDAGAWHDESTGVSLGHRRLSIVDLSAAGHQPMTSASGRFVVVYNGEIYNHLALRDQLASTASAAGVIRWRGHSDTETLLACVEQWGIVDALQRAVGMFALALWDRAERTLTLARDRMGEKPLYYGVQGQSFLFGSELKALYAHPAWNGEIDREALALYMRHSAVPAPWTIFRGIQKLPPGSLVTLRSIDARNAPAPTPYWSMRGAVASGQANLWTGSAADAISALDQNLREAVRDQMVADVPLGAFLSGGIDSSTVVALMQAQSSRPVKTFSIGFNEEGFNEAHYAKAVAKHLGTDHTELYLSSEDARAAIPSLASIYDEPFADSSQLPTYLVAGLARKHVTVSLSGDGGDELFGGYSRYFLAAATWNKLSRIPLPIRRAAAATIRSASPSAWDRWYGYVASALPTRYRFGHPGEKLHKAAAALGGASAGALYKQLVSHWDPAEVVVGASEPMTALADSWPSLSNLTEQMMAWDSVSYLPDDILAKVDRAAMAVSLETRVPMLDHRVVEFAWRLPLRLKVRDGQGKWILRQVLNRYVPGELIDRPKMGFGVPIDAWLRGPLKEWADSLLNPSRLRQEGYFKPEPIMRKWAEHLSGRRNWQYHLWDVLMFQSWLDRWK